MQGPIVSIGVEMIGPRNVQVEIMPVRVHAVCPTSCGRSSDSDFPLIHDRTCYKII